MAGNAALTIGRDYCRGCKTASVQGFAGWATADGHENSARPRAFYRQCATCGTMRLVLGNVNDAEGLCRTVLKAWLERAGTGARVRGGTDKPFGDGSLDADDGLAFLQAEIWNLYLRWLPHLSGGSFLAYAVALLPRRLAVWSRNTSGEAETRPGGRRFPKAHAASVSTSLDALSSGPDDEGGGHVGFFEGGSVGARVETFEPDYEASGSSDVLRALADGGGGGARAVEGAGRAAAGRFTAAD